MSRDLPHLYHLMVISQDLPQPYNVVVTKCVLICCGDKRMCPHLPQPHGVVRKECLHLPQPQNVVTRD